MCTRHFLFPSFRELFTCGGGKLLEFRARVKIDRSLLTNHTVLAITFVGFMSSRTLCALLHYMQYLELINSLITNTNMNCKVVHRLVDASLYNLKGETILTVFLFPENARQI